MSPSKQARATFRAIKNDPVRIKARRDEFLALIDSRTGTEGGMQVTDANVNGQNFSAKWTSDDEEKFHVLSLLIGMLDNDSAGSTVVQGRFS